MSTTSSFRTFFHSKERENSPQVKKIVRIFSNKFLEDKPDDDLAQSLALKEDEDRFNEEAKENIKAEWQQLFLPSRENTAM